MLCFMGILKSLGDFLFGKDPDIFDANGRVRHNFSDAKWEQWNDRLKANPEYDWKNHVAKENAMNPAHKTSDSSKKN